MNRLGLAALALLVLASACSQSEAAPARERALSPAQPGPGMAGQSTRPATPATVTAASAAVPAQPVATGSLPRLVFFMNPRGMPCQMQDAVLKDMASELAARATLVYYRTTESDDLAKFEQYGIRSLPSLVLTDPSGRELRRTPPGIRSADEIRQLIAP